MRNEMNEPKLKTALKLHRANYTLVKLENLNAFRLCPFFFPSSISWEYFHVCLSVCVCVCYFTKINSDPHRLALFTAFQRKEKSLKFPFRVNSRFPFCYLVSSIYYFFFFFADDVRLLYPTLQYFILLTK